MPAGVAGLLILQTVWLLPALDARALVYISGKTPPASNLHLCYVVAEAAKLAGLLVLGIWQVHAFRRELTASRSLPGT